MEIVTLTPNPAIDKSCSLQQILPEVKLKCSAPVYEPGGGGINVSRAIKKLGGHSLALYLAGGPPGQLMHDLLNEEGIEFQATLTEGWTRENFIATETSSNRQYRFGMPGAIIKEAEWQQLLRALKLQKPSPKIIVASGSLPPGVPDDFYRKVAKIAKEVKAKCFLDTSGMALSQAMERDHFFLLKPNLKELCELTGQTSITGMGHEKAALQLVDEGKAEMVVVSLGAKGAILATKQGVERVVPPTIVVKSTVGAGDSMMAGLALAYARGATPREMLMYGVACGTAAAMSAGTELCSKTNVDQVYQWLQEKDGR